MSMITDQEFKNDTILEIAKKMAIAARTAPKARGIDNIIISIPDEKETKLIAEKMKEISKENDLPFFTRDADNVLASDAILIIGTKIQSIGLKKCGMCGYKNCDEKNEHPNHPCVFNTGDLGIAIGSAASIAMDNRVDNRILYTVGQAVLDMNFLGEDVKVIYGIPLSASGKNIFFDRK